MGLVLLGRHQSHDHDESARLLGPWGQMGLLGLRARGARSGQRRPDLHGAAVPVVPLEVRDSGSGDLLTAGIQTCMARPSRLSHWKYGSAVTVTGSPLESSLA